MERPKTRISPSNLQRPLPVAIATMIAVAALIAGFLWTNRLALAERLAVLALSEAGIAPVALSINTLTTTGATVTDIVIGATATQRIKRLQFGYAIDDLHRGHLNRIQLSGVQLTAAWQDGVLTLPGLPSFQSDASNDQPRMTVAAITVDGYRIDLKTEEGPLTLSGTHSSVRSQGGIHDIAADFTLRTVGSSVAADIPGKLQATWFDTGEILCKIIVENGSAKAPNGALAVAGGDIQFLRIAARPQLDARLRFSHLTVDDRRIDDVALDVTIGMPPEGALDNIAIAGEVTAPIGRIDLKGALISDGDGAFRYRGESGLIVALDESEASVRGTLDLDRSAGGDVSGHLKFDGARIRRGEYSLSGAGGNVDFALTSGRKPTVSSMVQFTDLAVPEFGSMPGRASFRLDGDAVSAEAALSPQVGRVQFGAAGILNERVRFTGNGKLAAGPLLAILLPEIAASGSLAFKGSGTLEKPLDLPADWQSAVTLNAEVDADIDTIQADKVIAGGAMKGSLRLNLAPGLWQVESPDLLLATNGLSPETLNAIPAVIRHHFAGDLRLNLKGRGAKDFRLQIRPQADGYLADLRGAMRFEGNNADVAVNGTSIIALHSAKSLPDLQTASGRFALDVTRRDAFGDPLAPLSSQTKGSGKFTFQNGTLTLMVDKSARMTLSDLAVPGILRTAAPVAINADVPLQLQLRFNDGVADFRYEGGVTVAENRLEMAQASRDDDILLQPLTVSLEGRNNWFTARLNAARISLPDRHAHATGISLSIQNRDRMSLALEVDEIFESRPDPIVVPLRLSATATLNGSSIVYRGSVNDAPARLSVHLTGRHDFASASGTLSLDADPLTFLPTVLQPSELFPAFGNVLRDVDGTIGASVSLRWRDGTLNSAADIFAELNGLEVEGAKAENVAASVTLNSLFPPTTPPNQEIHVGHLDVGVPLSKGRIEFQLESEGRLKAALRELDFFGGRIESDMAAIPTAFDEFTIPLRVTGVKLKSLFALADIGDLEATGTLNGTLPLVVENGSATLRNGLLESAPGGGFIRYRPEEIGPALADANEGTALFLKVVHDFKYDNVKVTFDEDPAGGVASRFKIRGRNEAVYGGVPVELNITMSGPLREILHQNVKAYTLPDRLQTHLRETGGGKSLPSGN